MADGGDGGALCPVCAEPARHGIGPLLLCEFHAQKVRRVLDGFASAGMAGDVRVVVRLVVERSEAALPIDLDSMLDALGVT